MLELEVILNKVELHTNLCVLFWVASGWKEIMRVDRRLQEEKRDGGAGK